MNPARSAIDRIAAALVALGVFALIVAGVLFALPYFGTRFSLVFWRGGFLNFGICSLVVGFALRLAVMPGTPLRKGTDGGRRVAYAVTGVLLIAVPWLIAWLMERDALKAAAGSGVMAFLSACVTVPVGLYFLFASLSRPPTDRDPG